VNVDAAAALSTASDGVNVFVAHGASPSYPPCFRQPVLVADGADIMAFVTGRNVSAAYTCSGSTDGNMQYLLLKRSHDGGATWGDSQLLYTGHNDFYVVYSQPLENGVKHTIVMQVKNLNFQLTSTDGGATWSDPTPFPSGLYPAGQAKPAVGKGKTFARRAGLVVLPFVCKNHTASTANKAYHSIA
jgi:hypothetical protein